VASSIVAAIFGCMLALLVFYDRSVEHRQRKLLRQAEKTDAIVGSMFPANIQRKLMLIDRDNISNNARNNNGGSDNNGNRQQRGIASSSTTTGPGGAAITNCDIAGNAAASATAVGTNTNTNSNSLRREWWQPPSASPLLLSGNRKSFNSSRQLLSSPPPPPPPLPPSQETPRGIDGLLSRYGNTKPMADFYPNTTIMMCDIAGFTAWSSARAPADVFRLLETIYGAFDDIARAEQVFKVETVGDCYVACAGLPVKVRIAKY